jgi:hypothetical protein
MPSSRRWVRGHGDGVGRALRERFRAARSSRSSRRPARRSRAVSAFENSRICDVPKNYDPLVPHEVRTIADRRAYETKRDLARREGCWSASAPGRTSPSRSTWRPSSARGTVVTVLCDTGERYFSLDSTSRRLPRDRARRAAIRPCGKEATVVGAGGLGCPAALVWSKPGLAVSRSPATQSAHEPAPADPLPRRRRRTTSSMQRSMRSARRRNRFKRSRRCARLLPDNARSLVQGFDVVLEGADNYALILDGRRLPARSARSCTAPPCASVPRRSR